ncbi:MAG: peptide deformylase [Deltaproteobacteria bacterium CG11_big_fil_rev_8_21_14_0_20_47_16]|nr:MAG: peptide deformylase [Deltaproteobacteria bacterium CG11_big_fil_rev_8_21_14_0_20_47_16]
MAVLPITLFPEPVLKQVAKPVAKITDDIRKLLDDMAETMYAAPGVGLAAPQVGVSQQLIVLDPSSNRENAKPQLYQLVNPKITFAEGEIEWEEGCLSIPGFLLPMTRNSHVIVEAIDRDGKDITIDADEFLAVILQHEIDHLHGKLLIDNVSRLKRDLYLRRLKKILKDGGDPTTMMG